MVPLRLRVTLPSHPGKKVDLWLPSTLKRGKTLSRRSFRLRWLRARYRFGIAREGESEASDDFSFAKGGRRADLVVRGGGAELCAH